ncbi:MAG TPA: hypothetical protein VE860_14030 [Chthoniobacterales bacterium]|nr:hypothetical protein [Chthoniobacterales bacterium]
MKSNVANSRPAPSAPKLTAEIGDVVDVWLVRRIPDEIVRDVAEGGPQGNEDQHK